MVVTWALSLRMLCFRVCCATKVGQITLSVCAMLSGSQENVETRSGLKRVHKDFNQINIKLQRGWDLCKFMPHGTPMDIAVRDRIGASVICMYAKMSVDSKLCDRFFHEADFLPKAISMLGSPTASHAILQSLITVAHHGSADVLTQISRKTGDFLEYLHRACWDFQAVELAVILLSRCITAVMGFADESLGLDDDLIESMQIPNLVTAVVVVLRESRATPLVWEHATSFISMVAMRGSLILKEHPSAINLLVALTRSPDLRARATGILGIRRLHAGEKEDLVIGLDMPKLAKAVLRPWPPRMQAAAEAYPHPLETMQIVDCGKMLQEGIFQVVQTRDLAVFGECLTKIMMLSDISLAQHNGRTSQDPISKIPLAGILGLPFRNIWDAPPHCIAALRARGTPNDADAADILEIKSLVVDAQLSEVHTSARAAIRRSPNMPYFHYALALAADNPEDSVRAARKGLRCGGGSAPGNIRFLLLYRALEQGSKLAIERLRAAIASERPFEEGFAAALCALEDAGKYLQETPPDTRNIDAAVCFYTLMLLLVRGHELQDGLPELKEANEKLEVSMEFSRFLGLSSTHTQVQSARKTLLDRMDEAQREWGASVADIAGRASSTATIANSGEAALARWLEHMDSDEAQGTGRPVTWRTRMYDQNAYNNPRIGVKDVGLYRCSWCGAPSAALRKCGGCQGARYCDGSCQKQHWTGGHRDVCKSKTGSMDNVGG
ncbi:hypothetical protein BC834DRAFT_375512 [Gloeopeniophorella convolvens]|nr:hypothetical protein BC834DRAFT_375512 [Gloeopeniophorella convolvens]